MNFKGIGFFGAILTAAFASEIAWAAPDGEQAIPDRHPDIRTAPPAGYCALDSETLEGGAVVTGYQPGLASGMSLVALYASCWEAELVRGQVPLRIDAWMAVEMNVVSYPSDDERTLGKAGAVELLCRDARDASLGHPVPAAGAAFDDLVAAARSELGPRRPTVYLGVVAEDRELEVCYLAVVRLADGDDEYMRAHLTVTGFSTAGDRWVALSVRRPADDDPASTLALARDIVRAFKMQN
ncbi:MAG: hypothetical protein NW216_13210 [Hyphomicrobium sp.]|nr:hypothetical protein [Hyphomicrobium sp.]